MDVGRVIAERFEIAAAVAKGGMGSVFRARDRQTGGDVAIKVLEDSTAETIARFEREGRVLAEIQHPSVVGYVGQGTTPDGKLWLAMDWIDGETLGDRLERGPLSIEDSLALGIHVARALGEAHARGLVHRDIKPSNLLLPRGDVAEVKVADFGIVHVGARSGTTQTGMLLGTPGYMAPEQARGEKGVDPRADVFSLGCVLFQCLTGRAAFSGEHLFAILAKILLEEAPRVTDLRREVPSALADLVATMLSKDVLHRPRDGATVARLLEGIGHATPSGVRIARARSQVGEEEQRIVSVVLAGEPHGADANSRTLSPADHERLAQIRETTLPADSRFEILADGTILVAIWGRANARDQAGQAVHAAASISAVMPDPVVVATGRGVMAGTWPVGEVIDRAARMLRRARKSHTGPGVLVDQLTAGLLDSRYDLRVAGESFVVLREHRPDDSARRLCGVPTKCVGRDKELRLLEDIYAEVRAESGARAVVVVGSAGVGKSRVRQELLVRLGNAEPFELLIGRGDPMRAGSPFVVLAHALRWTMGITDGQPLADQRMRLAAHLARWFSRDALQRVAMFLGEMIGVPPEDGSHVGLLAARRDPVLMNDLRREAWLSYVRALTSDRALVIVLEDMHFGDSGTVALIDAALRDLADHPIFVIALARPELRTMFPRLWEHRLVTEVSLGELSKKAAEKLVRDVLGDGIDKAVMERVIERAGGNAFFLEELIRAVGAGDLMLPETVLATVSGRLEALPPDARRVLRAGSVFGERFSKQAVAALVEIQVDGVLDDLTARELLYRRASSRGTGDAEYVFRHALVREAAYAMLTAEDKELGHQLAGDWLESAGEPDAWVLAEHFERGGATAKAITAYVRAAEQALAANDFAAAIARAGRGISLHGPRAERRSSEGEATLDDDAEIAQLRLVQSEAHRWRGELVEAEACAHDAIEGLLAARPGWYRALGTLIIASLRRAEFTDAVRYARLVTTVRAADAEAGSARVACLCEAGRMLYQAGRYDLAEEVASAVASAMAEAGELEPAAHVQVHRLLAARARHIGDLAGDLHGYQQVLDAFTACGDVRNACNARVSVGFAHIELGDWAAAELELSRALADAERMWLETVATRARQNLALVYAHDGRFQAAIDLLERVIEESHAQGNARFEGWTRIYLSNVAYAMGDFARAERDAQIAETMFAETPPARAGALAALARARLRLGGEALAPARAAMAILDEFHGIEEFESLVWLALIEVLTDRGDPEAPAVIERARAKLDARAAPLADPEVRARFLDAVPENRRIRGHR